jgi:N-acetylneuraminic acid mutarotase
MATLGTTTVLFGGTDGVNNLNDTWLWDGSTWTSGPQGVGALAGHSLATLGGKIVMFGGSTQSITFEWNGTAWNELSVSGPPGRTSSAMATLANKIVLFGGYDGTRVLNDTWEWDGATWTKRNVTGPSARSEHAMATVGNKVVLFGGTDASDTTLRDTWEWDGAAWSDRSDPANDPPERWGHTMAAY